MIKSRIFVYDSIANPNDQRGVDRCLSNYLPALAEEFPGEVVFYSNRKKNIPGLINRYTFFYYFGDPFPRRISFRMDRYYGQFMANAGAKLFYSPYYGKIRTKIPEVYSAYDMIYEKYPEYYFREDEKQFVKEKKACFDRAAMILCISQNTAEDIHEIYPDIPQEKIKVVHIGASGFFNHQNVETYSGKPYFLFVGNRYRYKNFLRLMIAFANSGLSGEFDLRVISPSADFPTDIEREIIKIFSLEDHIKVESSVSEETLRKRYQNAFAYVFPSEYEGFGLPLIEAMASGTLTLASNSSSLPEIGGDVPIYFDPLSLDSMVEGLRRAAHLPDEERKKRITKGLTRAAGFTWEKSKKQFVENIKTLL